MSDLTAYVLAGGKSTRMRQDKAFLKLENETLLDRARRLAESVTAAVWIVGDSVKFRKHGPVIEDIFADHGPLGGIHSALRHSRTELNLIIAVDTPFLEAPFLEFLIQESRTSGAVVTVPRTGPHFHPLCAIYRREFAATSEAALIRGQNKIDALFTNVRVITEEEMVNLGFHPDMFRNLNTPEEWQHAQTSQGMRK